MKTTAAFMVIATVFGGLSAQVKVKTIIANGNSSNRYDIVILGDGYQATEQAKFDSNCQAVVDYLFRTEPYKTFKTFFNVHTVFHASKESGADHPDRKPPIYKDTVYDASYNTGGTPRCLYIKNTSQALRDAALAPAVEGRIMVIVNDSRYGGCAGTFAVTYNGSSMTRVQVHEFGHSFARLADEYDYPYGTYSGPEPGEKNVTTDPTGKRKWPLWIGYNGVSAFEGARYYRRGLFRPKLTCIMRSLGAPVCPVCAEQIVIYGYRTVSAIENPIPKRSTVTAFSNQKVTFSFTNLVPASGNAKITWKLDGTVQPSTTNSLVVDASGLAYGYHSVSVNVQDRTALVRYDPSRLLESNHAWTLRVVDMLPDFSALHFPATASSVAAGKTLRLESWIQNIGTVASPAVQVDHFLSTDRIFTSADTWLGGFTQGPLNPMQWQKTNRGAVIVPAHVRPGKYFAGMVIDRTNAVKELDETNNVRSFEITITAASCDGALSYDDPLNYPPTGFSVKASAGGVMHPVVTARCNVGDSYLILFGCSGTTPGTSLPPNLTLPLNLDACTQVLYGGLNNPLMVGFLGKIDAGGFGRARLTAPAGLPGTVNGHFAALVFDSTAYKRVTNAVGFAYR